jgi:hypothetical protein
MDEKGVFPQLVGGLGNQMFILAAGYVVSRHKACPLYLTKTHTHVNPHNTFDIDYKKTIFQQFGIHLDKTENEFLKEAQDYVKYNPGNGFRPWNPSSCQPGTILNSYYQYYPPFAPYEEEIRYLYKKGLEEFTTYLDYTAAFVHIRRGDYLKISHVHFVQPISYYEKGVRFLLEENPDITKILVFSDDIEWVKQQPFFQEHPLVTFIDEPHELKALALMSQCRGGAVCANSTFSWWGAFLGAYEMRNPVFVPKRWISDPIYELFPLEWHVLD